MILDLQLTTTEDFSLLPFYDDLIRQIILGACWDFEIMSEWKWQ